MAPTSPTKSKDPRIESRDPRIKSEDPRIKSKDPSIPVNDTDQLFRLPTELRLMIYEYALSNFNLDFKNIGKGQAHTPPLLLANKVIRGEATSLYIQYADDWLNSHRNEFTKMSTDHVRYTILLATSMAHGIQWIEQKVSKEKEKYRVKVDAWVKLRDSMEGEKARFKREQAEGIVRHISFKTKDPRKRIVRHISSKMKDPRKRI